MSFSVHQMLMNSADERLHSKGHQKGLSYCKTPRNIRPPAHITPFPKKKGTQPFLPQNKHPIVGCLGAAAWSFCLMARVRLPEKQYSAGTVPRDRGVTRSSRSKPDNRWESVTCERRGSLQVRQGRRTGTSKRRRGEIRCLPRLQLSRWSLNLL